MVPSYSGKAGRKVFYFSRQGKIRDFVKKVSEISGKSQEIIKFEDQGKLMESLNF